MAKQSKDKQEDKLKVLMRSQALATSSYDINVLENRLFCYCLFSAQRENNGLRTCSVRLSDFQNLIKHSEHKSREYIEGLLDNLVESKLKFIKDDDEYTINATAALISMWEYNQEKEMYKITFVENLYNHIVKYTIYAPINLEIMGKYQSFYAQKLYDLLRLWSRENQIVYKEFTVDYLRFVLGTNNKYPEYKNFNQKVLSKATKEINKMGNMQVDISKTRNSDVVRFKILDNETKEYFKKKSKIGDGTNVLLDMNTYVNLPRGILTKNAATHFLKYCFGENIFFTDVIMNDLLFESVVHTQSVKKVDLISMKDGSYAEFLENFKNRVEEYFDNIAIP